MIHLTLGGVAIACAAVLVLAWPFIIVRALNLCPTQKKLAQGIADASARGLTPPVVAGFWRAMNETLDRSGIRKPSDRRYRMIHALRMCRLRLSPTKFEEARRMMRKAYSDI